MSTGAKEYCATLCTALVAALATTLLLRTLASQATWRRESKRCIGRTALARLRFSWFVHVCECVSVSVCVSVGVGVGVGVSVSVSVRVSVSASVGVGVGVGVSLTRRLLESQPRTFFVSCPCCTPCCGSLCSTSVWQTEQFTSP